MGSQIPAGQSASKLVYPSVGSLAAAGTSRKYDNQSDDGIPALISFLPITRVLIILKLSQVPALRHFVLGEKAEVLALREILARIRAMEGDGNDG
jgi:hypothetical protein